MSDPLRIALVAEGPTDGVVIEAALRSILKARPFILQQIFPEGSDSFGEMGAGWVGVYRWCHKSAQRGEGSLSGDQLVFLNYDVLVLHLDADVAGCHYNDGAVTPEAIDGVLPCDQPCPPPAHTTNRLRKVLLSWCRATSLPARTVICMPSKSMEAWVVAALFPTDTAMRHDIECFNHAETRLGQQPKAQRFRKKKRDYQKRADKIIEAWPRIAAPGALSEAHRFQLEFLATVSAP